MNYLIVLFCIVFILTGNFLLYINREDITKGVEDFIGIMMEVTGVIGILCTIANLF